MNLKLTGWIVAGLIFNLASITVRPALAQDSAAVPSPQAAQIEKLTQRLDQATREIESLRQEVQLLRQQQVQNQTPTAPSDSAGTQAEAGSQPSAKTIQASPADSGTTTTLPTATAKALTAGYDGEHFFIASDDHRFKLSIEGQLQLRYIYNNRGEPTDGDDDVLGFQTRRAKLGIKGQLDDPRVSFKIKGAFNRSASSMYLSDAWVGYDFDDNWFAKAGIFDNYFSREGVVSSKDQQAVERSAVTKYYWDNTTKGLMATYKNDRWRVNGALTAGPDQATTDFDTSSRRYEWALTNRTEYLVAGKWKQFDDFAAWADQPFGLLLGAGVSYNKGANYTGSDKANLLKYTIDASAKLGNGINLTGAFFGQHVDARSGDPEPGGDQLGFVTHIGAFIVPDKLDVFARYEYADLRGASVSNGSDSVSLISDDKINMLTLGTNYYFSKHRAKLTLDVVYTLDPLDSSLSSTSTGLLPDMDRGQTAVRSQLQLLF
ncbi:MAG: hypothetical protein IT448_01665 [Phycisphaerales bacterium]|nr:hypothetical protein [Phycisphaerales bacterium]